MAANKFATMLHRNTHKVIVILVYVILEWVLIILLLLNSFFSYLITKFSNYVGLKPPCLWCSRVDHILEPSKNTSAYRDLICDTHATEISKLSYCSTHQNLAESNNICEDCLASRPSYNDSSIGSTKRIAFVSWMSENQSETNGEKSLRCSCCNESLSCEPHSPKPSSWDALNHTRKDDLIIEAVDDDDNEGKYKEPSKPNSPSKHKEKDNEIQKTKMEENHSDKGIADEYRILPDVGGFSFKDVAQEDCSTFLIDSTKQESDYTNFVHLSFDNCQCCPGQDHSLETINMHLTNYIACEFNRLIPIELIDSSTTANQGSCNLKDEDLREQDQQDRASDPEVWIETQLNGSTEAILLMIKESEERAIEGQLKSLEIDEGDTQTLQVVERKQDVVSEECSQVANTRRPQTLFLIEEVSTKQKQPDDLPARGAVIDSINLLSDECSANTLIGTEESDHAADRPQAEEPIYSSGCVKEDPSSANDNGAKFCIAPDSLMPQDDLGSKPMKKNIQHEKTFLIENTRESGAEEPFDGSAVGKMEGGDAATTTEPLEAALKAERKALNAVYAELEEERSASAIAANQTMAMITRLQEEKATMQMEALQYQRMMEEQAEYDQEALQLLNELMTKKEKEKQELEKDLDMYREKVLDYEAKEKMRMTRRIKDGSLRSRNSSASCSIADESDKLSIDLNREARDDGNYSGHEDTTQNTSAGNADLNLEEMALDCVRHMSALDGSLAEFEEERLSILDQLQALEEKLITLAEDGGFLEDGKSIEHSSMYGAKEFDDHDFTSPEVNGISVNRSSMYGVKELDNHEFTSPEENGISKDKLYPERKTMNSMAKRLLPLFDAANNKSEEGLLVEEKGESEYVEMQKSLESNFELEVKKLPIEDEVDHVNEKLRALKSDREFLRHCMSSIKKGDKGVDLVQEVLQHLRDLKAVEVRVNNVSDDVKFQ
ncbi:hypothetical protein I3843_04G045100 [Carya illinoinensis]|uniref:GTD-binding domain-containing protein n=1 Tax=Carya illinoinensis TaxID=32201 RepID=A0A8T1QRH7_CARIL|nr:myosin-binding protein 3-like [Carya illinoinensis]XP_042975649.1 myosin-binding protein 3-like [Carya illinoinensis]XP_042975650.1 myosin-binding protein 3-like [Carya illinoinensis]KAG2710791.1 hypothetical protein I3760_04G045900 [Carya illinoinensis]KAG2710792.1 hypothetical protein I3760_04G045900 [Carya illinoinensis]KAG2710793.1 hypothetical protein I3760_04G045900 [Carya illinoinensis]KAG6656802.1 hypothetical protein CIPAW_04G047200 [Carya illinoinensis]KAG6656803.1 hypothetical 